jgi:hypothetical protein
MFDSENFLVLTHERFTARLQRLLGVVVAHTGQRPGFL